MLGKRSPEEMGSMNISLESSINVVLASSCEEEGLKPKIMEESSIGLSVTESIDIPPDSWCDSKFLAEPLMSLDKVIDYVLKVCVGLVSVDPTSHDDLESSLFNEFL